VPLLDRIWMLEERRRWLDAEDAEKIWKMWVGGGGSAEMERSYFPEWKVDGDWPRKTDLRRVNT